MVKNKIPSHLPDFLAPYQKFLIAYSGGLDSSALLHCFAQWREKNPTIQLRAIHIHHGLSLQADAWQQHCASNCQQLKINFIARSVKIDSKKNVEASARQARYEIFAEILQAKEVLVTAHTENDQAETMLLQLMRGAGVKGLAAMPKKTTFAKGFLARPFLFLQRQTLQAYANEHALKWIEDESNQNIKFSRNYIRHQIMPLLQQQFSGAINSVARSTQHCAEANELIAILAAQDYQKVQGKLANTLSISALQQLASVQQKNVLRYWIQQCHFALPSTAIVEQIQRQMLSAKTDKKSLVKWLDAEVRCYQNQLYLQKPVLFPEKNWQAQWDMRTPLTLPAHLGTLIAENPPKDLVVLVCFRRGGERFHPKGRQGSHPLKKLLQEWQIPPWQRDRIPLIYIEQHLVAVVGYGQTIENLKVSVKDDVR